MFWRFDSRLIFQTIWWKYSNISLWVCLISSHGFPMSLPDTNSSKRSAVQTATPVTWLLPLSACALLSSLNWSDLHVKTVIRHSMKFGLYLTRQIIRSLISFTSLKTKTVVDNMLPAVYWTRFMPTSAINWHVSRGSGVQIVNLLELWRLTYDLTHNNLKIWARCGLALSRWKHVCVMECLKRGEEINASPCDGILLGKTWIRLLGSR